MTENQQLFNENQVLEVLCVLIKTRVVEYRCAYFSVFMQVSQRGTQASFALSSQIAVIGAAIQLVGMVKLQDIPDQLILYLQRFECCPGKSLLMSFLQQPRLNGIYVCMLLTAESSRASGVPTRCRNGVHDCQSRLEAYEALMDILLPVLQQTDRSTHSLSDQGNRQAGGSNLPVRLGEGPVDNQGSPSYSNTSLLDLDFSEDPGLTADKSRMTAESFGALPAVQSDTQIVLDGFKRCLNRTNLQFRKDTASDFLDRAFHQFQGVPESYLN